ncbi:MAG TPA: hypothetical protein VJ179_02860 [Patescibacteria group bacterium]|nr:hypothetical protein [Patescibacteria group bacterium]
MRTVQTLLRTRVRTFQRLFIEKDAAQLSVIVSFIIVLSVFMIGSFLFFSSTFTALRENPFTEPVNLYMMMVAFFLFFTLSIFSSMISGILRLFRSEESAFVLTTPSSVWGLFTYRFLEIWLVGSWALFVLGIPILFAFGDTYHTDVLYYVLSVFFLCVLSFLSTQIGVLLSVLIASIFGASSIRVLVWTIIGGAIPLSYVLSRSILPDDFSSFFSADSISSMYLYLQKLAIFSFPIPSTWLIHTLLGYVGKSEVTVFVNSAKLIGLILANWLLLRWFVTKTYRRTFQWFQEGTFYAAKSDKAKGRSLPFPRFVRGVFGALLEKDLIVWFRDLPELLHLFFLLLLFSFYFFVLGRVPVIRTASPEMLSILASFHLAAGGYLLTTIALRFVFPSVSLEGKGIRFLKSSPVSMKEVFWEKFVFSLLSLLAIAGILILVEASLFSAGTVVYSVLALMTGIITITVTSIMVSLGAAFPNYSTRDTERITTTLPGILATFCALFYVALVSFFLHDNFLFYFTEQLRGGQQELSLFWPAIGAVFLISFFLDLIILLFGARSLERQEI